MKCMNCGHEGKLDQFKLICLKYAGGDRCCGPTFSVRECPKCGKEQTVDTDRELFMEASQGRIKEEKK